jgi:hypothetical protein
MSAKLRFNRVLVVAIMGVDNRRGGGAVYGVGVKFVERRRTVRQPARALGQFRAATLFSNATKNIGEWREGRL